MVREALTRVFGCLGSTYGDNNCVHDEDVGVCCAGERAAPSVQEMPEGDDQQIYDLWREIDADGSGTVTLDELRTFVNNYGGGYDDATLQSIIDFGDVDGDGMLSYTVLTIPRN